ncbi:hypothetical protein [Methylobacterium durans]|uniref:DUF2188 domain-containing protein n=1 Tax=Methylobacterium durans TaxID=2202825 RepID=A0A2U8W1Y8_9HYPH|nr:hypothetical protein [Methylobacterium durans]AWN40103.1 hypothetical protein DK389_05575 [Methylobacterium durans]
MEAEVDWSRYAVVHWTVDLQPDRGELRRCGRTRAFAGLAEAVLFATELNGPQRQTARVDCGGQTYHLPAIERFVTRSDFPHREESEAA